MVNLLQIDAISVDTSFNISDYVVGYSYLDNIDLEEYMCSHLLTSRARETFRTIIRIICGKLYLKIFLTIIYYKEKLIGVEPSEISVYYFLCLCNSTFGLQNFLSNKLGSKECYIQVHFCSYLYTLVLSMLKIYHIFLNTFD